MELKEALLYPLDQTLIRLTEEGKLQVSTTEATRGEDMRAVTCLLFSSATTFAFLKESRDKCKNLLVVVFFTANLTEVLQHQVQLFFIVFSSSFVINIPVNMRGFLLHKHGFR